MRDRAPCPACTRRPFFPEWRRNPQAGRCTPEARAQKTSRSLFRLPFPASVRAAFLQQFSRAMNVKRRFTLAQHERKSVIGYTFREQRFPFPGIEAGGGGNGGGGGGDGERRT